LKIIVNVLLFKGKKTRNENNEWQENFAIGIREDDGIYLATTDDDASYSEKHCFEANDRMFECDSMSIDGDIDWDSELAEVITMYQNLEEVEQLKIKIEKKGVPKY